MKKKSIILLTMILSCGFSLQYANGAADLNGTWEGPTYAESAGAELVMTLVLKHEGDNISGTIKDDMGYLDCKVEDATLEDDVLKFKAMAVTPVGDLIVEFSMKVAGSAMEGEWQAEDGSSGTWSPEKKVSEFQAQAQTHIIGGLGRSSGRIHEVVKGAAQVERRPNP